MHKCKNLAAVNFYHSNKSKLKNFKSYGKGNWISSEKNMWVQYVGQKKKLDQMSGDIGREDERVVSQRDLVIVLSQSYK